MPLFNPSSEALIRNWNQTIEKQIHIKLITTGHTEDNEFKAIADHLLHTASNMVIKPEKAEKGLPGFLLKENITYSAFPLEKELEPFLEALSQLNSNGSILSESIRQSLDTIDIPVRLTLYIALQCPHCPFVVRTVIPL
ncbi:MAG: hypothetical protein KKE61_14565, partial [Proteobacteria bacterium]|nr:hypothetical protein [Pseudomonadota bacterium]